MRVTAWYIFLNRPWEGEAGNYGNCVCLQLQASFLQEKRWYKKQGHTLRKQFSDRKRLRRRFEVQLQAARVTLIFISVINDDDL